MDATGQSLLRLLFNPGESICVSVNAFGFSSIPLESAFDCKIDLISPNESVPLTVCNSSDLTLVAINPINGFRRDCNVTAFRSYLIEMDAGSMKDQLGTIKHLKMPFSAQVFSGNKSVHTVITLDADLPNEKVYRTIGDWIFNIITLADKNCRNPSRSIRIPGAYREPGKKQRLIKIGKRVPIKDLMDWLKRYPHLRPIAKPKRVAYEGEANYDLLSPWVRAMLNEGIRFDKGRNQTWFALAVDFALAGFSEEVAISELGKKFVEDHDFKEKEWLTSIGSAFKYASEKK